MVATVSEKFSEFYRARREMSTPTDMVRLLIARLYYPVEARLPASVNALVGALRQGKLDRVTGRQADEFAGWVRDFLTLGRRTRGVSFYPLHPVLSRSTNGEEARADGFIATLVESFSVEEAQRLFDALWGNLPPFEQAIYDLVQWQLSEPMPHVVKLPTDQLNEAELTASSITILDQTREDLLALAAETSSVQAFTEHAGRLLALALTRFFLAQADIEMTLPIYVAPAADTHDGVRALAHEAIEVHRALFERALQRQFRHFYKQAVEEIGGDPDPVDAEQARQLTQQIFHRNANVVSSEQYADLRREYGDLCGIAHFYYWQRSGASSRFLRQLHASQLNLAKKAGIANSRSQYSSWHYYWLAPSLAETLLLVGRSRLRQDRMLVVDLLRDWRKRYSLAMLIDDSWADVYRNSFPGLGNPEALNEANQRRFNEILAERGRLHKNSDDFPWVILRD